MIARGIAACRVATAIAGLALTTPVHRAQTIEPQHLDGVPFSHRLAFSRIVPSGSGTPGSTQTAMSSNDDPAIAWSTVKAQPFKNAEGQGIVVGSKLYSFGGFDSEKPCCTPTKRSFVYDPGADTWTAIADLPYLNDGGATHHGVATDGTDIYIVGGYIANAAGTGQIFGTNEAWQYHVESNTYSRLPDLPDIRAAGRLEHLNGGLHYFGGTNKARTEDVGSHYVLDLQNPDDGWKTAAALPNPRHHMGSAVLGGKIYAIGGQHGHDRDLVTQVSVHAFNPGTGTWSAVADLPRARSHHATVVLGERIIALGGEISHGNAIADVSAFDHHSNTWSEMTPLPVSRRSGVAGNVEGVLYFTGGNNSAQTYRGRLEQGLALANDGSVFGDGDTDLPERFELIGNYPNPFNPQTTIRYGLPKNVHVRLQVFDLLGRRVALLIDEFQEAGFHSIRFEASQLASGIYLYRIEAGSFTETAQMVILR